MDDGTWLPTLLGTLGGLMGAGLLALIGWWLNRRRLRKAIALVLFDDAKAAWAIAARAERDLAKHAGVSFEVADELARVEKPSAETSRDLRLLGTRDGGRPPNVAALPRLPSVPTRWPQTSRPACF